MSTEWRRALEKSAKADAYEDLERILENIGQTEKPTSYYLELIHKAAASGLSYDQMEEKLLGDFYRDNGVAPRIGTNVNHPDHYQADGLEAIDVIEAFKLNFHLGNAIKYILRADKKGDKVENLEKAIWYLEREIENDQQIRGGC